MLLLLRVFRLLLLEALRLSAQLFCIPHIKLTQGAARPRRCSEHAEEFITRGIASCRVRQTKCDAPLSREDAPSIAIFRVFRVFRGSHASNNQILFENLYA